MPSSCGCRRSVARQGKVASIWFSAGTLCSRTSTGGCSGPSWRGRPGARARYGESRFYLGRERGLGALPVVTEGRVIGIVTATDVIGALVGQAARRP